MVRKLVILATCLVFLGCAAVRMAGNINKATGDVMVKAADEEEAKKKAEETKKGTAPTKVEAKANAATPAPADNSVSVKKSANVRSGPSTRKSVVFTVRAGVLVEALEENGGWTKIRNDSGKEGWVRSDLINR